MSQKTVDTIGQACPTPVVPAIQARRELDGTDTLEVLRKQLAFQ